MHTVMWTINVNEGTSRQDMLDGIKASAPDYKGVAGLVRTYFSITPNSKSVVEMCLWESRSAADKFYTSDWETEASRRWQTAPMTRQDWDTPVVVES
jgi:hypothetical protein